MRPSSGLKPKDTSKPQSSLHKKPSVPVASHPKETKQPQLPLTEEEKKIRKEIIEPIHQFECLRNVLLQWVFINNYFKEHKEALKQRMEVEFYDRTQQVLLLQEKAMEMKVNISKEEAIKELEEILSFEYPLCGEVSTSVVDFEENLEILKDYMENALKKIEVGENIVIEPEGFNEEIVVIKNKLEEIKKNYAEEWEASDVIESKMKEYIELTLEEHQELMSLMELMNARQSKIEKRNFENYTDFQEDRIKALENLIFSDI